MLFRSLVEGTVYNIGYKVEPQTFTNDEREEITYDRRTIGFLSIKKEKEVTGTSSEVLTTPQGKDLLSPTPPTTQAFVPTQPELELMNKLKALPQADVDENNFRTTMLTYDIPLERLNGLWKHYKGC